MRIVESMFATAFRPPSSTNSKRWKHDTVLIYLLVKRISRRRRRRSRERADEREKIGNLSVAMFIRSRRNGGQMHRCRMTFYLGLFPTRITHLQWHSSDDFFFYIVVVVVASFICPRSVLFHWDIGNSRQRLVVLPPIFRSVSAFSQLSALVDVDYEHLSLSFPLSFSLDCPLMRRYGLLLDVDCSHAYFGGGGAPLWHSSDSQRSGDDRDNISGFFLLWLFPPLGPVRLHLPVTSSRVN